MFTIAFGVRTTLRPSLPWKPRFEGWIPLLGFIHFLLHISFKKSETKIYTVQEVDRQIRLDSTKRKTLQPGGKPTPKGYRDELEIDRPETSQVDKFIERFTNKPINTDQSEVLDDDEKAKELKNASFTHKFFGTQLVVGDVVIKSGLPRRLHLLEIMPNESIYIDGVTQKKMNPTDLLAIKLEIEKSRRD